MPHTSTSRTSGSSRIAVTALAVASLLAAFAFVAVAFVARPGLPAAPDGLASSGSSQVALGPMASSGHPDFVGVADPRPATGFAHLVIAPASRWALDVALMVAIAALAAGASSRSPSRWRRWRARLEGAPPIVA